MMDIDYTKLKFFIVAVRCGSLTAAAKELFRTQSALSQALTALERQLGMKLITWEGKKLNLTREGKLVYNAAQDRLMALDEQVTAITSARVEVGGCIEMGMLNDASTDMHELIFTHIAEFRDQYPTVTFKIHFDTSAKIEQALLARELDLGFLINLQSPHRFRLVEITTEQHLIVTSPKYLERVGNVPTMQDVVSKNLIDIDEHFTCFTPWVQHHDPLSLQLLEKKLPVISVPDFRLIRKLVLDAQGIAVLPKHLITDDLKKGIIIQLLPKLSPLKVWVNGAIERGALERPCEKLFLKKINGDNKL